MTRINPTSPTVLQPSLVEVVSENAVLSPLAKPVEVNGSILDYSSSLEEMARDSDLIVVATVTEQEQFSPLSVTSTLKVGRVIKGAASDKMVVFQLGSLNERDQYLLGVGGTYFLFLGKQSDSSPDTYFVKGGHQGLFEIRNGKLFGDPSFVSALDVMTEAYPYKVLEGKVRQALK